MVDMHGTVTEPKELKPLQKLEHVRELYVPARGVESGQRREGASPMNHSSTIRGCSSWRNSKRG